MQLFAYIGAVLLALLVMLLPALAHKQHRRVIREDWRYPLRLVFGVLSEELGAVVVQYYVRGSMVAINGSATPPTAAQASQVQMQKARITMAAEDIQALFTHNWGLDKSSPTYYDPEIMVYQLSDMTFYAPSLTFDVANTNVVTINKNTGAGLVGIIVTLRRPHSMGQ